MQIRKLEIWDPSSVWTCARRAKKMTIVRLSLRWLSVASMLTLLCALTMNMSGIENRFYMQTFLWSSGFSASVTTCLTLWLHPRSVPIFRRWPRLLFASFVLLANAAARRLPVGWFARGLHCCDHGRTWNVMPSPTPWLYGYGALVLMQAVLHCVVDDIAELVVEERAGVKMKLPPHAISMNTEIVPLVAYLVYSALAWRVEIAHNLLIDFGVCVPTLIGYHESMHLLNFVFAILWFWLFCVYWLKRTNFLHLAQSLMAIFGMLWWGMLYPVGYDNPYIQFCQLFSFNCHVLLYAIQFFSSPSFASVLCHRPVMRWWFTRLLVVNTVLVNATWLTMGSDIEAWYNSASWNILHPIPSVPAYISLVFVLYTASAIHLMVPICLIPLMGSDGFLVLHVEIEPDKKALLL